MGCLQRVLFYFRTAGILVVSAENRVEMMILFCLKGFMTYLLLLLLKIAAVGFNLRVSLPVDFIPPIV